MARNGAEAEFRALAQGIYELLWLKRLITDLIILCLTSMKLYTDSKCVISMLLEPYTMIKPNIEIDHIYQGRDRK